MKLLFAIIALLCVACDRGHKTPEPQYDVNCKATHIVGAYHGSEHSQAYNYNIVLSTANADSDSFAPDASYYYFEIYSDIYSNGGEYVNLPVEYGTSRVYRYDPNSKNNNGYFAAENSYAIFTDSEGIPTTVRYSAGTLTLKRNDSGVEIVADLVMEDGSTHCVKHSGKRAFRNLNNKPYSTLSSDLSLSYDNMAMYSEIHKDVYPYIDCHYIILSEDAALENGTAILLELFVPSGQGECVGEYSALATSSDDIDTYTYLPGAIEQNALRGAWYAVMESGSVGETMAPIVYGKIAISHGEHGSMIFRFECSDDANNAITGSVTSTPTSDDSASVAPKLLTLTAK